MIVLVAVLLSAALAGSYLGVALVRRWVQRCGIVDVPNLRSSHVIPTPRGGGVVFHPLVGATLLVFTAVAAPESARDAVWFVLLGALVAGVSWLDDIRSLPTGVRFAVHALAALGALHAFGAWSQLALPLVGEIRLGPVGWPVTFLWVVGLTNAYNFMDGIDGIAAGQGVVGGLAWAVVGWVGGWPGVMVLGLTLGAVCGGFLAHNWPPARIFMGDVGSAFLGYSFAVLPLIAGANDPYLPFAAGLVVWPFVLDTTWTLLRRIRAGENILEAHRSHLYQRMVGTGRGHSQVAGLYVLLAVIGAGLALLWWMGRGRWGVEVLASVSVCVATLVWITVRLERRKERLDTTAIGVESEPAM